MRPHATTEFNLKKIRGAYVLGSPFLVYLSRNQPKNFMATRASVIFKHFGEPVFAMYKHYDGYPDGLGKEIKEIVSGGKLVNGLGPDKTLGSYFNGYGCMWATIIAKLKNQPGDVYICKISDVGQQGEDYVYEVDVLGEVTWKNQFHSDEVLLKKS